MSRRLVVVLFLDLVGWTRLAERVDPEPLRDRVGRRTVLGRRLGSDTVADVGVLALDRAEQRVKASNQQQGDDGNHKRVLNRGDAGFANPLSAEAGSQIRKRRG